MTVKLMIVAGALLASTSAFAQVSPSEQTSQDLICQLADSCPTSEAVETDASDAVDAAPMPAGPAPRVSSGTRGFSIANKVSVPAQATKARPNVTSGAKPGARVAATPAKKPTQAGKGAGLAAAKARPAAVKNAGSGRADLRVSFVTGSAELTEAGQREAVKFAEALQSPLLAGMRFRIEGHTDAVGGRQSNLELSRRRAQAVVDYLAGKGADRTRFEVIGYGFDKPLAGTTAKAAANRRVEVVRIK
jgi:OOP family OmpA-OmpF porin